MSAFSISNKPRSTKFKIIKWSNISLYVIRLIFLTYDVHLLKNIKGTEEYWNQLSDNSLKNLYLFVLTDSLIFRMTFYIFAMISIIGMFFENRCVSSTFFIQSVIVFMLCIINIFIGSNSTSNQVIDSLCRIILAYSYALGILLEGGSACTIFGLE